MYFSFPEKVVSGGHKNCDEHRYKRFQVAFMVSVCKQPPLYIDMSFLVIPSLAHHVLASWICQIGSCLNSFLSRCMYCLLSHFFHFCMFQLMSRFVLKNFLNWWVCRPHFIEEETKPRAVSLLPQLETPVIRLLRQSVIQRWWSTQPTMLLSHQSVTPCISQSVSTYHKTSAINYFSVYFYNYFRYAKVKQLPK